MAASEWAGLACLQLINKHFPAAAAGWSWPTVRGYAMMTPSGDER